MEVARIPPIFRGTLGPPSLNGWRDHVHVDASPSVRFRGRSLHGDFRIVPRRRLWRFRLFGFSGRLEGKRLLERRRVRFAGGQYPHAGRGAAASTDAGNANAGKDGANGDSSLPQKGSPEWLLGQMMVLFGEPLAAAATPQEQSDRLRERNQKLVEMAQEIIEKTHKDKVREPIFNKAVQFLAEARLKLATNGSQEDAKALSDDAQALYRRDPNSVAAADAAFAVARLAHTNAQLSRSEPRFIQEFAIQVRLFATPFPQGCAGRAAPLGRRTNLRALSHGRRSGDLLRPVA